MKCSGTAEAAKGRKLNEDRERIIKLFDSCKDDTGFISYKKSVGLREKLESYISDVCAVSCWGNSDIATHSI